MLHLAIVFAALLAADSPPPAEGASSLLGTTWEAPGLGRFAFEEGGRMSIRHPGGRVRPGSYRISGEDRVEIRALIGGYGGTAEYAIEGRIRDDRLLGVWSTYEEPKMTYRQRGITLRKVR